MNRYLRSSFVCLSLGCLSFGVFGCSTDLGPCDPDEAMTVVYDEDGFPLYAGQAQVAITCGNGAFCHSASASGANRFGADLGFDFDLHLASTGDGAGNADGLLQSIETVRENADSLFVEVDEGRMPPYGPSGLVVHEGLPRYRDVRGRRLAWIDSEEGIEIFRNWLSCGAPIVERVSERSAGAEVVGDIVPVRAE